MSEIHNNEQIEELQLENKQLEQLEQIELLSNNDQYNETLQFINDCNMSIFNFTKDDANNVILKPK
jgi:hypothetical protein